MRGGQIVALVFAIILLFPGGCYLFIGLALSDGYADDAKVAVKFLLLASAILSLAGFLFWIAFRRRRRAAAPPDHSER